MAELLEVIENLRGGEAEVSRLFNGDDGTRMRDQRHRINQESLVVAAEFMHDVQVGKRPMHHLKEAMTTSDFPILFADILDRQLLGYYQETAPTWRAYCRESRVPDFRNVKRFAVDGAESALPDVGEREEYPEDKLLESKDEYAVKKTGRRIDLSWEAIINDDLDAFLRTPERLARAARRTESKFATELFVDTKGPHASLYTAEHKNIVEKNPVLSIEGLQKAMVLLSEMVDVDGEPIVVDMVTLVVPPALKVTAQNILNATLIDITTEGGTEKQRIRAQNWMRNGLSVQVEPYIPHVASKEHGNTSWFLFAEPSVGRPALEMGFLRGFEQPSLYEKVSDARRIGGGGGEPMESFDDDSRAWRIRHVLGGTRLLETGGAKATVASNGSGA